jgi:hypothetical protein
MAAGWAAGVPRGGGGTQQLQQGTHIIWT